jgi:hypothetical protein
VIDKQSKRVICLQFGNGKKHDFRLFKESKTYVAKQTHIITDSGYTGIDKIHENSIFPKKRSKKTPLTKEERKANKKIAALRVLNEHIIGRIKVFRVLSSKYRNRRKRFGLRFNLIAGIYNKEYAKQGEGC